MLSTGQLVHQEGEEMFQSLNNEHHHQHIITNVDYEVNISNERTRACSMLSVSTDMFT